MARNVVEKEAVLIAVEILRDEGREIWRNWADAVVKKGRNESIGWKWEREKRGETQTPREGADVSTAMKPGGSGHAARIDSWFAASEHHQARSCTLRCDLLVITILPR
jgi:hypothetical protein